MKTFASFYFRVWIASNLKNWGVSFQVGYDYRLFVKIQIACIFIELTY